MDNSKALSVVEYPVYSGGSKRRKEYEARQIYDELLIYKPKYRKRRSMMSRKPRVFVVNRGMHDFSKAEKYGELYYLTEELQVKLSAPAVYRMFTDILSEESLPSDYLLGTGLAFLNQIATAVFDQLHGRVNALIYNRANDSYTALPMKLPEHILQRSAEYVSKYDCAST